MKSFFRAFVLSLLIAACNSQPTEQEVQRSLADSLFDKVMAGHNAAMPKMMKLERLQGETRAAIDSFALLPEKEQKKLADYKVQLDSTLKALDDGDFAMMKWMDEFQYDSLKDNEPERVKYLQSELDKVNKVKEAVLGSISMADSVLAK